MTAILQIKNLTKRYGGLTANNDISFDVQEGEILSVIGPNGAGKSTLFKQIASFVHASSGEVLFRGKKISDLAPHIVARMGVVRTFRETTIFKSMTVREKIIVAHYLRSKATLFGFFIGSKQARADEAEFGKSADDIVDFLGLQAIHNELTSNLPQGHLRALGMAIGLATQPTAWLLEEPFAGLNPDEPMKMVASVRRLREDRGVTGLLVEQHSRMALSISSRAYAMSTGSVVLSRNSRNLMGDDRIKAAYLGGDLEMRILVLNPNTTASMTAKIGAAARRVASPGTEIMATNPAKGPASIEGYYDEAISLAGLLGVIRDTPDFDAVVIACFDDIGLDAARCLTDRPVIGIGEAAYHYASLIANEFSLVTTLARSVPALEHNLHRYGLSARCARARSSEVAVLELEHSGSDACNRISAEIGRAVAEDRSEAIVLRCAGMTDLANDDLAAEHGLPVLDGVSCAVALAESMVRLGLRTSRLGGYAPPLRKLRLEA